jgi:DNA-binding GntR family transcriptional regulator
VSQGITELQRPVPLYMQVVRQLRAQIASGELADGDRLPSQREMMQRWHISMQTASKVIGALKTEGLAIPSVGRDTIVAPGAAARIAAAAVGTHHVQAETPHAETLDVKATAAKTAAPAAMAEMLGIPSGRRVLCRQETRLDGGQPVSHTIAWFPPAIADKAPRLATSEPLPAGSMAYITESTGNRATRAVEESAAMAADAGTSAALSVPAGSPVLVVRAQHHTSDGKPIAYTETTTIAGQWRTRTLAITGN